MWCGPESAASTRSGTSAPCPCGGSRRLRRSRRRKTCSGSWRNGTRRRSNWRVSAMSGYTTGRKRPFTGDEYLESLRDGREIWIYGERVKDVTTHPAFRNTVRMIARLYDALHDEERRQGVPGDRARKDVLTAPTDTGSGGYTHKFFRAPRNAEEMVADRDAIAEWARVSYGWIGRSPDYKAAFMATLGANSSFYQPYEANATRWYT